MKCPNCKSKKNTKAGKAWRNRQKVQRYRCSDCGYVFTEPNKQRITSPVSDER